MTWALVAMICQVYVAGLLIWMGLAVLALLMATTTVVPDGRARWRVAMWASRLFLFAWAWPAVLLLGLLLGIRKAALYLVDKANFEEFWKGKK